MISDLTFPALFKLTVSTAILVLKFCFKQNLATRTFLLTNNQQKVFHLPDTYLNNRHKINMRMITSTRHLKYSTENAVVNSAVGTQ